MRRRIGVLGSVTIGLALIFALGWEPGHSGKSVFSISEAEAAGGQIGGPNEIAPERYVYCPGTERLVQDEVH